MTLFIQSIEPRTNDVGKFRRFDQRFVNAIWSKVMDADIADWERKETIHGSTKTSTTDQGGLRRGELCRAHVTMTSIKMTT